MRAISFKRHRFPPDVIRQAVWDCQDFRVRVGIMGKKESHYVPTQGTGDPG